MDSFVDKLAHRLTAQEMIKANSAAETEEMNKLKSQVDRYNECLKQMEQLTREMAAIEQRVNGALNSSMTEQLQALVERSTQQVNQVAEGSVAQVNQVTEAGMAHMQELVDKSLAKLEGYQQEVLSPEAIKEIVDGRMDKTDENLHKECVKVYRNIQAVVTEESGKSGEAVQSGLHNLSGKLNGGIVDKNTLYGICVLGGLSVFILAVYFIFAGSEKTSKQRAA